MGALFDRLREKRREKGALFLPLVDQDRIDVAECAARAELFEECGADAILVGSSFALKDRLDDVVEQLRSRSSIPVLLFPGSAHQISRHADGVLFLTLLSGRNPQFLAEEQVRAAPRVRECGLEPIPTGYLLVGGGGGRTVHFVSRTEPIPADRTEIVMAHALAAEYMGMKAVYLEAGSGASSPVPPETIRAVRDYVSVPLIVGGGIRDPEQAAAAREAGADWIVVGHTLEQDSGPERVRAFACAVHGGRVVSSHGG